MVLFPVSDNIVDLNTYSKIAHHSRSRANINRDPVFLDSLQKVVRRTHREIYFLAEHFFEVHVSSANVYEFAPVELGKTAVSISLSGRAVPLAYEPKR